MLSLAFAFDREESEVYSFALSYPYSYSRSVAMLKRLAKRKGPEINEDNNDLELQRENEEEVRGKSREIIRVETLAKSVVSSNFINISRAFLAVTTYVVREDGVGYSFLIKHKAFSLNLRGTEGNAPSPPTGCHAHATRGFHGIKQLILLFLLKQGRPASAVTITDDVEADVNGKNLVIILTRSHPSDAATSFVVQGNLVFIFPRIHRK